MAISIKPQNKGKLHKALGVAQGSAIPTKKLDKALGSANPTLKKEAVFANNAKSWNKPSSGPSFASNKPPKPPVTNVASDRGDFKIKG